MPPRTRKPAAPPKPAHRAQLEADVKALDLVDHKALVDLGRHLADELDRPPSKCSECGGHELDPRIVQRYLDVLTALGIGEIPAKPERDTFREMLEAFAAGRGVKA